MSKMKKLSEISSGLNKTITRIRDRFIPFLPRQVVVIDLGKSSIKLVAAKQKREGMVISSCAEVDRSTDDVYHDLESLLSKEEFSSGAAVIVTDQARFLASELNMPSGGKISADKLLAAASWEMEPYLDFPPSEGLFVYQLQKHKTSEDSTPVLISAVDRKTYSSFSEILKKYRLTLRRAYSPEAAFTASIHIPEEGKNKMVIDCYKDILRGILFLSTGPFVFQNISLEARDLEESVKEMIQDLAVNVGKVEEIVIAGDEALDELIQELKPEFENIRLWGHEDALAKIELAPDLIGFGPKYAAAVGAALQELKLAHKPPFGVTDRVFLLKSVAKKAREDRRVLPALVLAIFFLSITGHYTTTKMSMSRYRGKINGLEEEKRRLLVPVEKKRKLEEKIREIKQKKEYLEKVLSISNRNLLILLDGLSCLRPPDVVLTRLFQEEDKSFTIEGRAFQGRSVAHFIQRLSGLKFCEEARLKNLENNESRENEVFPHHFAISLRFKEE